MNKAVRLTASLLGLSAGIAGFEHGYFEVLQGRTRPDALLIFSIGPPCQPDLIWNRCEPALTIVPDFFVTGILAIIFGILTIIWSVFFVQCKRGGLFLILLSIGLLLFGGGLFPPIIGTIAGLTGMRINKPLTWWRARSGQSLARLLANFYPWALIAYLVMVLGQWFVGYFFNEFLMPVMSINVLLFMSFLVLAVFSSFARDAQTTEELALDRAKKQ